MTTHALLSPSSAARWTRCPGSVALCVDLPDETSTYAADGTATHEVAALCLADGRDAHAYLGRLIEVDGAHYEVDAERAERVQLYLDYVRSLGGNLLIEQRLAIEHITGEAGATGTSDAVVLLDDELIIVDLKDGRGVRIDAERNEQLVMYAHAAHRQYEFFGYERVRMVIVQPKLGHISEWALTTAELAEEVERISAMATTAMRLLAAPQIHNADLNPGEKQCKFCRAKATCPALRAQVIATITDDAVDFAKPIAPQIEPATARTMDNTVLANLLGAVDLIEDWCKAIRGKALKQLTDGHTVPGYKLVAGKKGDRSWARKSEAEETLKAMRLKVEEMYNLSLISPTSAEKLAKAGAIGPRQWQRLQSLITQADGKPTVAPESDKRQAIQVGPNASLFADLVEA